MNILNIRERVRKREIGVDRERKIALECLRTLTTAIKNRNFEKMKEDIIFGLISIDPGNPLIFNFAKKVLKAETREKARKIAEEAIEYIEQAPKKIARHWPRVLRDNSTVLVHSYSLNVKEMLLEASKKIELEVYVTCGSPAEAGRIMAREICKDVNVTLIPDTAANYVMPEIDVVLVGGFAVTKFGLIGSVGTSMIVLSAKWNRIPVYALVEIMKASERIIVREMELRDVPPGVGARCPAYDLTRHELITGYVCEEGIIKPERFYPFATSLVERW